MGLMQDAHDSLKNLVWSKGEIVPGRDSTVYRKDADGRLIKYSEHGNRHSEYGWEIDHIRPVRDGGDDEISNLRPLHWRANVSRN